MKVGQVLTRQISMILRRASLQIEIVSVSVLIFLNVVKIYIAIGNQKMFYGDLGQKERQPDAFQRYYVTENIQK